MSSPSVSFPANVEEYTISAYLNSSMLFNFLMGIYTMVYGGTIYVYISKKPANTNRRTVLTVISVLYLLSFVDFIFQWYLLDWALVANGDTRDSIFWSTLGGPAWFNPFCTFLLNSSLVVSDGLLLWRCYHVWGKSLKVIALPSLLLVAEFALSVAEMVLTSIIPSITSDANAALVNNITTSLTFMSLATTISATCLIGYRILSASQINISRSQRAYNRIVTTIIESSAIYSLVLLFFALAGVLPPFYTEESPLVQVQYYIQAMLVVISGMAPTIMVARLALVNTNDTVASGTITHISGLNFGSQQGSGGSSSANGTGGRVIHSAGVI